MRQKVQIYTDGACSGNPGPGGWAAILLYDGRAKELSGFEADTTNNRMEILAAIKGMEALKSDPDGLAVEIYSDSTYVVNAHTDGWLEKWKRNNWRTALGQPVKNRDLWTRLDQLDALHRPAYKKVKGHADNPYNNRCDELAVAEIMKKPT